MSQIDFPFHPGPLGGTAFTDPDTHIRELIEQVLFTVPGERVNRPTFGSGLQRLLFAPISEPLAAAANMAVQGALQQWLGDLIAVQDVSVEGEDSTFTVIVTYRTAATTEAQTAQFTRPL
jgi:phage baseplate assembly protein W